MVAMLPLSQYLNGPRGDSPLHPPRDHVGDVLALLHRHRRDARQRLAVRPLEERQVADHEHVGPVAHGAVRVHDDPPGAVGLDPADRLGDQLPERVGLHARRPDHRLRFDPVRLALPAVGLDHDVVGLDVGDVAVESDLDAHRFERLLRLLG